MKFHRIGQKSLFHEKIISSQQIKKTFWTMEFDRIVIKSD